MKTTKIDRQAVYEKYDGHCAYCGKKIPFKAMQVDHIFSKRAYKFTPKERKAGIGLDEFKNLNPSCRMCNFYKSSYSLESFRSNIKTLHRRFIKIFIVRLAVQYGIITIHEWDSLFYFEKHKLKRTK